ncbi:hypothetical protein SAMN05444157_0055 [Frankineae bacterium MT45]|nr:hypothetical protein SAMN05444157_0055 [Frankineae bacterium MT45]
MDRYQRVTIVAVILAVVLFASYIFTGWYKASHGLPIFVGVVVALALAVVGWALLSRRHAA